jgi:gamma-glutamyltranspeptidase/glutathione hydrolase
MTFQTQAAPHRPRIVGTRHMAAAAHYLAAQASFEILEAGGNAVDAGVAGGIALGVLQCEYVHFAGVAPIVIHRADTGETVTISGLGTWPRLADADWFRREQGGRILPNIRCMLVPAAPDAWITALERFGTMSFGEVAAAAIRFGKEGFATQSLSAHLIGVGADAIRQWPQNASIYLPGGTPPRPGARFYQRDLAASIQYMADEEKRAAARAGRAAGLAAARAAFYRGDIARKIADYHREHDGWLREDDLAGFRVDVEASHVVAWRGIEIHGCGPWCQGPVLLQALKLLESGDVAAWGHNTPRYVHHLAEALKLAFADRHHYYGDPKFVPVPMERLLSEDYAAARRGLIREDRAWPEMPPPGTAAQLGVDAHAPADAPISDRPVEPAPDTSYVCVVDSAGNAFSATPSDGCLDVPIVPGTGLAPSSRGSQSWTDPDHPACLAPGKRPRLTPSPALARRKDGWIMPFGTPGNDVQPQAMLQVFLNIAAFGMVPQDAVEAPRFASFSFPGSSDPHTYAPGRLALERRFPDEIAASLAARGHTVDWWEPWDWRAGCVCAIVKDAATGMLEGAADVRRPGGVRGW